MTFRISESVRNAQVNGVFTELNSGYIEFRTGAQVANTDIPATGTLLGTVDLLASAGAGASAGVGSATLPLNTSSTVAGVIGWARVYRADGTVMIDGTVSLLGGGGDIIVNIINMNDGDALQILEFTISAPAM